MQNLNGFCILKRKPGAREDYQKIAFRKNQTDNNLLQELIRCQDSNNLKTHLFQSFYGGWQLSVEETNVKTLSLGRGLTNEAAIGDILPNIEQDD